MRDRVIQRCRFLGCHSQKTKREEKEEKQHSREDAQDREKEKCNAWKCMSM